MSTPNPSGFCWEAYGFSWEDAVQQRSAQHEWADMDAIYACVYCGERYRDYVETTGDYSQYTHTMLVDNLTHKVTNMVDAIQHHEDDLSMVYMKALNAAFALLNDLGYPREKFLTGERETP